MEIFYLILESLKKSKVKTAQTLVFRFSAKNVRRKNSVKRTLNLRSILERYQKLVDRAECNWD